MLAGLLDTTVTAQVNTGEVVDLALPTAQPLSTERTTINNGWKVRWHLAPTDCSVGLARHLVEAATNDLLVPDVQFEVVTGVSEVVSNAVKVALQHHIDLPIVLILSYRKGRLQLVCLDHNAHTPQGRRVRPRTIQRRTAALRQRRYVYDFNRQTAGVGLALLEIFSRNNGGDGVTIRKPHGRMRVAFGVKIAA